MDQVRQLDDWRYSKDGLHHGAGDFIPAACRLEVRLKSHDLENSPLPDMWIIGIQWILHHMPVLSGITER